MGSVKVNDFVINFTKSARAPERYNESRKMIPQTLQLKNFLSYGDEPVVIDFRGMHTVCLSGENGHGKSAILDAITWALWGETRLGKRDHEQLIRIGADEMAVVFTFETGGQLYRVRRQRSKRSGGQLWELQQSDGAGGWRARTGASAADTERSIRELLRMSYDTFVNSAYLRQGRADEFVRQTANKRKEILCEILDLSRYDELEAKARLKMREAFENALDFERRINLATAVLAEETSLRERLTQCLARVLAATQEQEALAAEWERARERHHDLKSQQAQARQIESDLAAVDAQMKSAQAEKGIETQRQARFAELVSNRAQITASYDRLVAARAACEELDRQAGLMHVLEREKLNALHEIESQQRTLTAQLDLAVRDQSEIRRRLADLRQAETNIERLLARRETLRAAVQRRAALYDHEVPAARDRFTELKHERLSIEEKIAAAEKRLDSLAGQTEVCSVCGSPLPASKIAALTKECQADRLALQARRNEATCSLQECKALLDRLKAEIKTLDGQCTEFERADIEIAAARSLVAEIPALKAESDDIDGRAAALKNRIDRLEFALEARTQLNRAVEQLRALDGTVARLEQARARVRELDNAEKRYHDLLNAGDALGDVDRRIASIAGQLAQLESRRQELVSRRAGLSGIDEAIKQLEEEADALRGRRASVAAAIQRGIQEQGSLEEGLKRCDRARQDKVSWEKEHVDARRAEENYKQLAAAFGKQGVQALIIENAVPELASDANDILERLTDGDMSVQIDTQRIAKAKGAPAIETLEILISDNLGTRPLELYSGGESFRVSFALRIALSKLLARRAGARLQTLIIDEGFGTQDGKGREKLVDAIHAIKDDFERIIVITHVDELKEAFPSRIDVYKTPAGSQVSITEGGIIG